MTIDWEDRARTILGLPRAGGERIQPDAKRRVLEAMVPTVAKSMENAYVEGGKDSLKQVREFLDGTHQCPRPSAS